MLHFFLIVSILITISFVGLGIGIIIKGKSPETHIGKNENMKKIGITCAKNDSNLCRGRSSNKETCECCKHENLCG